MRISRRIAASLAVSALVLAGCSNDPDAESSATDSTSSEESTDAPTEEQAAQVDALISDEGMPTIVDTDGIITLDFEGATEPDVLQVAVIDEGDGTAVTREDLVIVNYAGMVWGSDTTFDSSFERGQPSSFSLSQVVQGWRDGLAGQTVGSRVIISVPADLGYGPMGGNASAGIGEEDTIVFVVDIIETIAPDSAGDADAEEVTPAGDLPITVEGGLGEATSITINDGAEEPDEETSILVAESDGEPVGGEGTTVYFQYSAATWDNSQSESSIDYGGVQNTTIGSGTVFDKLEGVPVGSRVLLLVPGTESAPAMAALVDIVAQLEAPGDTE
ncbi:FKBP-type peptidyl-prolyl cis-trans isomerase [Flaviflexus equikiangi]|uniref:peptidylprolyl isomerase n=1 Tax=Flaviflexus equikiangi TaxID=2758573 RepID=A0ABS2TFY5_9ACTO|nr:FKBP-type peptidyl-prolyl cis-trans isomerase [Flaviflexus equikiangi]MBM9433252.1 FKBP-type peptidyl-prolyl cis-trans isomerase [Flaviflexus equikiangi]